MSVTYTVGTYCNHILSCYDGSFYTGVTNDLERRLAEHQAGRGARWTSRRLPVELAFCINNLTYDAASRVEQYVKTLSRQRKDALVARDSRMLELVEKRAGKEP